LIHGWPVK
jgi:hypothetical protein